MKRGNGQMRGKRHIRLLQKVVCKSQMAREPFVRAFLTESLFAQREPRRVVRFEHIGDGRAFRSCPAASTLMATAGTPQPPQQDKQPPPLPPLRRGISDSTTKPIWVMPDGHRADLLGQFLIDAERQARCPRTFRRSSPGSSRARAKRGPLQPPGARYTRMGVFSLPSKYASSSLRASSVREIIRSSNAASSVAFSLSIKAFCGCFRDLLRLAVPA